MIEWVYKSAKKALPKVIVATDDTRIVRAVKKFGGDVMMTPKSCKSGTDRMSVVARKVKGRFFVNIQGDEPLLSPGLIRQTVKLAQKTKGIATAACPMSKKEEKDPSAVKVVVGEKGRALYFSRNLIPFPAHGSTGREKVLKHYGLYVYPKELLTRFVRLPQPELEKTEKLEQLRALYHGLPIYVTLTKHQSIGVDTKADLQRVNKMFRRGAALLRPYNKELLR